LSFLFNRKGPDAILWQLNYGLYGTLNFFLIMDVIVRFTVVIVGLIECHMHTTAAFVLFRIGSNDCSERCRFSWNVGDWRYNCQFFIMMMIVIVMLFMASRRKCRNRFMNHQALVLIFVVFYIKDLHLFLLLLPIALYDLLRFGQCLIIVLNNDLNYWLRGFGIVLVIIVMIWRRSAANVIIVYFIICMEGNTKAFLCNFLKSGTKSSMTNATITHYIPMVGNCSRLLFD
jgi:hypothetical protein